jgi:hypothetical protein
MAFFSNSSFTLMATLFLLALPGASFAAPTMDPRFELDPNALSGPQKSPKSAVKSKKSTNLPSAEKTPPLSEKEGTVYTVKPGDGLFKIVMRYYRLGYHEAKSFIEEIRRENKIHNVNLIRIGQKIVIPTLRRRADGSMRLNKPLQAVSGKSNVLETPGQSFKLEPPVPMLSEQQAVGRIRETWDKIVPARPGTQNPLAMQTSNFSLALDAERYPTFTGMDGGLILIDQNGTISPQVKSLLQAKESSLRIVADSPSGTKKFMSSMLEAGGFYSVEENFNMDFGVDPKLSFHADFKIEKSSESLIMQDIVLMNSGLNLTSTALGEFLKKEGFLLYEPFASLKQDTVRNSRPIHQITSVKQPEIVDAILKAFSISSDRDRRLDVFTADKNGISLSVKAERYFERGGQRYVVIGFDGNPVNSDLLKILEANGFRVIVLEAQDDFRKISEKLISRMKIKGTYAKHNLLQDSTANYSLQMTGFKLDDDGFPGGGLFLTNLEMDRIIRELLTENGYSIISK